MNKKKQIIKKILVIFLTFLLIFSINTSAIAEEDDTVGDGVATIATCAAPAAGAVALQSALGTLLVQNSNPVNSINTASTSVKECILDGIANVTKRALIRSLVKSTVNWANGGFDGVPNYAEDFSRSLKNSTNKFLDEIIEDSNLDFICSEFEIPFKTALNLEYRQKTGRNSEFNYKPKCSISKIGQNTNNSFNNTIKGVKNYYSDSSNFFRISAGDNNSIYQKYFKTSEEFERIVQKRDREKKEEKKEGGGYMPIRDCNGDVYNATSSGKKYDGSELAKKQCPITTPGRAVYNRLAKATNSDLDQLVSADELDEVIGTLIKKLFQSISKGGIRGLSVKDENGKTPMDNYDSESLKTDAKNMTELRKGLKNSEFAKGKELIVEKTLYSTLKSLRIAESVLKNTNQCWKSVGVARDAISKDNAIISNLLYVKADEKESISPDDYYPIYFSNIPYTIKGIVKYFNNLSRDDLINLDNSKQLNIHGIIEKTFLKIFKNVNINKYYFDSFKELLEGNFFKRLELKPKTIGDNLENSKNKLEYIEKEIKKTIIDIKLFNKSKKKYQEIANQYEKISSLADVNNLNYNNNDPGIKLINDLSKLILRKNKIDRFVKEVISGQGTGNYRYKKGGSLVSLQYCISFSKTIVKTSWSLFGESAYKEFKKLILAPSVKIKSKDIKYFNIKDENILQSYDPTSDLSKLSSPSQIIKPLDHTPDSKKSEEIKNFGNRPIDIKNNKSLEIPGIENNNETISNNNSSRDLNEKNIKNDINDNINNSNNNKSEYKYTREEEEFIRRLDSAKIQYTDKCIKSYREGYDLILEADLPKRFISGDELNIQKTCKNTQPHREQRREGLDRDLSVEQRGIGINICYNDIVYDLKKGEIRFFQKTDSCTIKQ